MVASLYSLLALSRATYGFPVIEIYGARHLVTATFAQWQIWPVTDTWGVNRGVARYLY